MISRMSKISVQRAKLWFCNWNINCSEVTCIKGESNTSVNLKRIVQNWFSSQMIMIKDLRPSGITQRL